MTEKIQQDAKTAGGKMRGPFFDNAAAWYSYLYEFSEEEQKKQLDNLLEMLKDNKELQERTKRLGAVRRNQRQIKYICLPGGRSSATRKRMTPTD